MFIKLVKYFLLGFIGSLPSGVTYELWDPFNYGRNNFSSQEIEVMFISGTLIIATYKYLNKMSEIDWKEILGLGVLVPFVTMLPLLLVRGNLPFWGLVTSILLLPGYLILLSFRNKFHEA